MVATTPFVGWCKKWLIKLESHYSTLFFSVGFMLQNLSFPAPEKDCFRKWQWAPIPPCLFIMESELHTKRWEGGRGSWRDWLRALCQIAFFTFIFTRNIKEQMGWHFYKIDWIVSSFIFFFLRLNIFLQVPLLFYRKCDDVINQAIIALCWTIPSVRKESSSSRTVW